jgi:hypothetical protein
MNWDDLIAFIAGILAKVLFDLLSDPISRRFRNLVIRRAKSRYSVTTTPVPSNDFLRFRIGNLEIPVMSIVGSPESVFHPDEVIIRFHPILRHQQDNYPVELLAAQPYLFDESKRKYHIGQIQATEENIVPRLDKVSQGPEIEGDKRGRLYIDLSLTSFDTFLATNKTLDYCVIPKSGLVSRFNTNQTIRDAYCVPPYEDLEKSVLANLPAVHVAVISRNLSQSPVDQLIIRRRSQDVITYKGFLQVSATGYMSLAHHDSFGVPSPFYTAIMEAKQEIADSLSLLPKDFNLIGVALRWEDLLPIFYGYVETGFSVQELLGDFRRDAYEGTLQAIPFNPKSVLTHIVREKWEPVSALAAVAAVLVFHPHSEVLTVARELPAKNMRDFFENLQ